MKKHLGQAFTLIFLIIFIVYFVQNIEQFKVLLDVPILVFILIAILKVTTIFLNGLFIRSILHAFKTTPSIIETTYISTISSIGNYFIPLRGGASIRAIYLKNKHKLSYSNFISTLSGNYVINFLISSFVGILSLVYIHITTNKYSPTLYLAFGSLFLVTLYLSLFQLPRFLTLIQSKNKYVNKIFHIIKEVSIGWNQISSNKRLLLNLVTLIILNYSITFVTIYVEFWAIGSQLTVISTLLYSSLGSLALLLSITPGSIGIRESIFLFSSSIVGLSNINILQTAVIDRGILFFVLIGAYIVVRIAKLDNINKEIKNNDES